MQTVEEKGVVAEIREGKALVRVQDRPNTESTMVSKCCESLAGWPPVVEVQAGDLEVGDVVSVEIPRVNPYLTAGLVGGLSAALFIAGYVVGGRLSPAAEEGNVALLGGIIGLIVAFLLAWAINRMLTSRHEPVVRKVS